MIFSFSSLHRNTTSWAMLLALGGALLCAPAIAASPAVSSLAAPVIPTPLKSPAVAPATTEDKLLVEADSMVFDKDKNTVSAVGGVILYYKNKTLQADRVTYDHTKNLVTAEGKAKLVDEKGDITYGTKFVLSGDFRDGFIEGVKMLGTNKTIVSSPRIERSNGDMIDLSQAAYTACQPCKDHPEREPIWQIKAYKMIENQTTHKVYFEDAWLVVAGYPIAYVPNFSAPDATVKKLTGVLTPSYISDSHRGYGIEIPYFIDLAPDYDLLLDPSVMSKQGAFGDVTWRQLLPDGKYSVRLTGIDQMQPSAFLPAPYGAGSEKFRGSAESEGKLQINDKWTFGWDITALSDRYYLNDYKIKAADPASYYFQDVVSSAFLRAQSPYSFFDLSAYHFEGLVASVEEREMPLAVPVLDYNKMFLLPENATHGLGGVATVDLNVVNINRAEAAFQSTGLQTLDRAYNLYNVCASYVQGQCILRGIAGDYARISEQTSWERKYVDPIGEVWTPFVFAQMTGESADLNSSNSFNYFSPGGSSTIANASQGSFFDGVGSENSGRVMPGVGLDYRYPFSSDSALGKQAIEPIAQVIVRPNENMPKLQPNEDAQSLVFDETTLFAWNKYSGYDRVEGGARVNYGGEYTASFANGGHANIVGGESIQMAGQNSYAIADGANTGLESGLDKKFSNYVIGETLAPFGGALSFESKQQFDSDTYQLSRLDAIANLNFHQFDTGVDYGRYAAQPLLGWAYEREGILAHFNYKFLDQWSVGGNVVFDLSRHSYDLPGQPVTSRFFPTNYGMNLNYKNDCTTVNVKYASIVNDPIATTPVVRDQSILVTLTLRTVGDVKTSVGVP